MRFYGKHNGHPAWTRDLLIIPFFLFLAIFLGSCGDNEDDGPEISYHGVKKQARVDADNAYDLAVASVPGIWALNLEGLSGTMNQISLGWEEGTKQGECGGVVKFRMIKELSTFTGNFSFEDYYDCYFIYNGTLSVSGPLESDSPDFEGELTISTDYFKYSIGKFSESMTGTYSHYQPEFGIRKMTLNLARKADSGAVYRYENFDLDVTIDLLDPAITFSEGGRFFHPQYGYIDILTAGDLPIGLSTTPAGTVLLSYHGGDLVGSGDENSSFNIMIYDGPENPQFDLEADLDGNGNYDGPGENLGTFDLPPSEG